MYKNKLLYDISAERFQLKFALVLFYFLSIILTIFHHFSKIKNKLYKKYVKNYFDIYDQIKVNRCCLHDKMF